MNTTTLILIILLFVTTSISAYLLGFSRGKKGQKEIIKHIYKQEERPQKRKGFAQEEIKLNEPKTKRYRVN